jgi:hypothetical protein
MCVCLRLCLVDGSRCARKTLRCGLVLDVAQRTIGSERVHMFLNNADIEVLCQICVVGNTPPGPQDTDLADPTPVLLFQTCGHHTDRLNSRNSVIVILVWKCVYVCVSSIMLCRWFKVCSQNVADVIRIFFRKPKFLQNAGLVVLYQIRVV